MSNSVLTSFISLIKQQQLSKLPEFYLSLDESDKVLVLKFCFEQGTKSVEAYPFFQDLCVQLIKAHTKLPELFISGINTLERLSFFTPALSEVQGYSQTNRQDNTLLHALCSNTAQNEPPFNYLRSLVLFERNESIAQGLATMNNQSMRPIDCYLTFNHDLRNLPDHELSALFTLIEVQTKTSQIPVPGLLSTICQFLVKNKVNKQLHHSHQRVMLIASSFQTDIKVVCKLLRL